MATTITSRSEIPSAPFYVTCTDTFLSGWGEAKNKTNRLILPCANFFEARIVEQNANNRTDQKNVRICSTKPRLRPTGYLYQVMDREEASRWYKMGGFSGLKGFKY